ncbi:biotin transporter BioY [Methanomethylovorans sp.]|uniref:biotin transporter BioY n=1 Tax=Methanomethylovorans sp. TaxID=2758717 RepID=UPI00351CAAF6
MVYNISIDTENSSRDLKRMVFAALFASLIAVGAYMKIPLPLTPVPVTMQVFFVLLAGSMLGSRWGTISMIVYLLLGIAGFPVFAGGASGPGVLFGPTGGYLIGFIFAAFITGKLSESFSRSSVLKNTLFMVTGLCIIYALGALWLMSVANLSFRQTMVAGVLPFIVGDLVTLLLAAFIAARYEV